MNTFGYVDGNPLVNMDPSRLLVYAYYYADIGLLSVYNYDTGEWKDAGDVITGNGTSSWNSYGGPIPLGKYEILDQAQNPDFFRLDAEDSSPRNDVHDFTGRTELRLHSGGGSLGCVTATNSESWEPVKQMIYSTSTQNVTDYSVPIWKFWARSIKKYGTLEVTLANMNRC